LAECYAGSEAKDIVESVGLKLRDLFSDSLSTSTEIRQRRQTREKPKCRRQEKRKPNGKAYTTAHDAVVVLDAVMAKKQGKRVAYWPYHDADGNEVAVMVRYDLPTPDGEKQAKEFRPVARHDGQWFIKGMLDPRPLYRLPALANATRVYITEGEKAAEAARAIGLVATTSAHGAQSPEKTDWSPLAGKECVILPDNDDAGKKYALAVAAILAKLSPPAIVKVLELPGLSEHGDIADWVNAQ